MTKKKPEQPDATERIKAVTAFLTYQLPDGRWRSSNDLADVTRLEVQRLATPDDFVAGSQVAIKDITALESALNVVAQMNRALAQRIQNPEA